MKLRILAVAAGMAMLAGTAFADETVESLRQPVIEICKSKIGSDVPSGTTADGICTCMIDGIIKDFGDDALGMLKVLKAGLNPDQVTEVAALLGLSEQDAKTFISRVDDKMDPVEDACVR